MTATIDVRQHILDTAHVIMSGKGFSAVGLNEILQASGVPKGSFYHYFGSKEAFGEELLKSYFADYLTALEAHLTQPGRTSGQRLITYFESWLEDQSNDVPQDKCLVVKLAAEVSDLSEVMRAVLKHGTAKIIGRIAEAIEQGVTDGSVRIQLEAHIIATTLYQLWVGASVRAKITRDKAPLESALFITKNLLGLT